MFHKKVLSLSKVQTCKVHIARIVHKSWQVQRKQVREATLVDKVKETLLVLTVRDPYTRKVKTALDSHWEMTKMSLKKTT